MRRNLFCPAPGLLAARVNAGNSTCQRAPCCVELSLSSLLSVREDVATYALCGARRAVSANDEDFVEVAGVGDEEDERWCHG